MYIVSCMLCLHDSYVKALNFQIYSIPYSIQWVFRRATTDPVATDPLRPEAPFSSAEAALSTFPWPGPCLLLWNTRR